MRLLVRTKCSNKPVFLNGLLSLRRAVLRNSDLELGARTKYLLFLFVELTPTSNYLIKVQYRIPIDAYVSKLRSERKILQLEQSLCHDDYFVDYRHGMFPNSEKTFILLPQGIYQHLNSLANPSPCIHDQVWLPLKPIKLLSRFEIKHLPRQFASAILLNVYLH